MPQVVHSTFQNLELHEDKRIKVPVRAASTANVSLTAPGATIDGVTLASNDRVLLKNQTATAQNGIYVWTGAATTMTRATDANAASLFYFGFLTYVREGTANAGTFWAFSQPAAVTLETTAITFIPVGNPTFTSEVTATDFKVIGLTGATAGTRFVGATTTGAPSTGTFALGDVSVAQNGVIWICTVAGTPGSWIQAGFVNPMTTVGDLIVGGTAGAPTRLAAGTATTVLTSNGPGVSPTWQAASGGGGSSGLASSGVVPLQTIGPLGAAQASVVFSVTAGYRNLRIVWQARGDTAANNVVVTAQFNGDTAANYDRQQLFGTAASAGAAEGIAQTSLVIGEMSGNTSPSGSAGAGVVSIPNYSSATFRKSVQAINFTKKSDVSAGVVSENWGGEWRSTAAITSMVLAPSAGNFAAGSFFQIWGELDSAPTLPASQSSLIQEVVLGTAAATISLTNIPQTYRDLRIELVGRGDVAALVADVKLQVNGDTTANYDWLRVEGNATGVNRALATADTSAWVSYLAGATADAGAPGESTIRIDNYAATVFQKAIRSVGCLKETTTTMWTTDCGSYWRTTGAITSLTLLLSAGNFIAGSIVRLYGEPATSLPKIAEVVLSSAQASVTFSAIPQTYRSLKLRISGRGDTAAAFADVRLQFNGDTGTNYDAHLADISGSIGVSTQVAATFGIIGHVAAGTAPANSVGQVLADIVGYTGANFDKTVSFRGSLRDGTVAANLFTPIGSVWWHPATPAAITSITLTPSAGNFAANSVFELVGEA